MPNIIFNLSTYFRNCFKMFFLPKLLTIGWGFKSPVSDLFASFVQPFPNELEDKSCPSHNFHSEFIFWSIYRICTPNAGIFLSKHFSHSFIKLLTVFICI